MKFLRYFTLSLTFLFFSGCGSSGTNNEKLDFSSAFITTWKVSKSDNSITIPTEGSGYDYAVDWGDGNVEINLKANATHVYEKEGTYTVKIIGKFPRIYFQSTPSAYGSGNGLKLLSVKQWGANKWSSMNGAFYTCKNMIISATDNPDLSNVEDMSYMFYNYSYMEEDINQDAAVFNTDISEWDVSNVRDMSFMFSGSSFNQDISDWDVSNVTNMEAMFVDNRQFNQDISSWDVSSVTNMSEMFACAVSFNQALGTWDVSSVTKMDAIFASNYYKEQYDEYCETSLSTINYDHILNGWSKLKLQPNINFEIGTSQYNNNASIAREKIVSDFNWKIKDGGKVVVTKGDYSSTVEEGTKLTFMAIEIIPHDVEGAIYKWEDGDTFLSSDENYTTNTLAIGKHNLTLTVTNKNGVSDKDIIVMNIVEESEYNPFVSTWDVSKFITIYTYQNNYEYDYVIDWGDGTKDYNVKGNINHSYEKSGHYTIKISGKFPAITNDLYEYWHNSSLTLLSVEAWGNIEWKTMASAFSGYIFDNTDTMDIPNLSKVTSLSYTFRDTWFNQDISTWDFSTIRSLNGMFHRAKKFNQNISSWNIINVVDMSYMFRGASSFNQDINLLPVSNVTSMSGMFQGAKSFNQDISSWDVSNVTNMDEMFSSSYWYYTGEDDGYEETISSFNQNLGDWNVSNVTKMRQMFNGVTLSTENYDKTLIGWSKLKLQQNVVFDGGNSKYSIKGKEAREVLMNDFNWTVSDGGMEE